MKSKKIIVAALVAVAAIVLAGCSPRSSMATLSTDSDSETAEVFSLAKVLNLGTNYLTSLDQLLFSLYLYMYGGKRRLEN